MTTFPPRKIVKDNPAVGNLAGLALGVGGGALFDWIGTPIPWLLGSLLTVAAVNLAGWSVRCPNGGRQTGQIFIGVTIGLYFTPAITAIVLGQLPWMVLVAVITIAIGAVGALLQTRIARLDPATAFLASVPGGMAEMINIAEKVKADLVALAISQLVRVTIVVITIPAALTYFGEPGGDLFALPVREVDWIRLAVLLCGCGLAATALNYAGMTNAWMLGSCAIAAVLAFAEVRLSAMPGILLTAAQVLIGASVGQRFERDAMSRAPRVILGSAIATVLLIVVSVVLAALIATLSGASIWSMIASTAPGGLAEMSVTAQLLGLGVPLVTGYHVIRVIMITLLAFPVYRLLMRGK